MENEEKISMYLLPNGKNLYIHTKVKAIFSNYIQIHSKSHESGGFILGYENVKTGSIIIDELTVPQKKDTHSRYRFSIKDKQHFIDMNNFRKKESFFLGTWHTHPQDRITPSFIDWIDWKASMRNESPAALYMIFIIVGRQEIAVWAGNRQTKKIIRIKEVSINE